MAHSLSAKKRVRQNEKHNTINRARKSQIKTQTKHLEEVIKSADYTVACEELKKLSQKLDKVASTSAMHKKTAARKKSRLTKKVNAIKAKEA